MARRRVQLELDIGWWDVVSWRVVGLEDPEGSLGRSDGRAVWTGEFDQDGLLDLLEAGRAREGTWVERHG